MLTFQLIVMSYRYSNDVGHLTSKIWNLRYKSWSILYILKNNFQSRKACINYKFTIGHNVHLVFEIILIRVLFKHNSFILYSYIFNIVDMFWWYRFSSQTQKIIFNPPNVRNTFILFHMYNCLVTYCKFSNVAFW